MKKVVFSFVLLVQIFFSCFQTYAFCGGIIIRDSDEEIDMGCFPEISDSLFSMVPLPDDGTVFIYFDIGFRSNLLFNIYDVSVFLDDVNIGTMKHGKSFEQRVRSTIGKHTIKFCKYDDQEVFGQIEVTFIESSDFTGEISAKGDKVILDNFAIVSRYSSNDDVRIGRDSFLEKIYRHYDRADYERKRRRADYTDYYILMGTSTKEYLILKVPKHVYPGNEVELRLGTYVENPDGKTINVTFKDGEIQNKYLLSEELDEWDYNEYDSVCNKVLDYFLRHVVRTE